jgi:PAS domain S-box-containing protein
MNLNFNNYERDIFDFALDNIPDAITIIDTNYTTIFFNKTSESYFNVNKDEILGKDLRDIFPNSLLPKVIDTEKSYHNIYNSPRENTYTVISAVPLYDKKGTLIGGLAIDRDITEFVKLSELLSKTQDNLDELERVYSKVIQRESFFSNIISNNSEFIKTINLCKNISKSPINVLLYGESGTGKELFAKAIHHESGRKGKYIALNCSAIPEELFESELFGYDEGAFTGARKSGKSGKFEEASGGTLFLDEIGEMPINLQPKILRALEEGFITRIGSNKSIPVDVRIISATNKDLNIFSKDGKFRKDLYYRLNTFQIELIPLRERKEDIQLLANKFLQQFCMENGINIIEIPNDILLLFRNHNWDGNIRELKNVIHRSVLLAKETGSEKILYEFLPDYLQKVDFKNDNLLYSMNMNQEGLEKHMEIIERSLINDALEKFNFNKKKTAEYLKIPRSNLYYKIEKYRL